MANAQTTIDLIFNGVNNTGAATVAALDNARKFSGSLKDATQPIADFTLGAVKLEAGLLAAGVAVTVFAVKTAGDFDGAFRQISTIINASAEDLAGFRTAILDYAAGSTQPLEQITNALGNAIGAGVDWSQSLELIGVAEKLAVATRADLDSTTKVLVSTINSYGLEMKDVSGLSDLFFKIIDDGDISMLDLSSGFARLAAVAQPTGISLQELGAAIATLTAAGIEPSSAMAGLAGAIGNIVSPSSQAKDLAAELGLNFNAAALKADGFAGLMNKAAAATGGNSGQMKILFGDLQAWMVTSSLAGPQNEKFNQTFKAMGDVTGATATAFEKMQGSLDVSTAKMKNAFEVLAISIGDPLLDKFGSVAAAIAKIFNALSDSAKTGGLGTLVKYVENQMDALTASIETVAKNLPAALAKADFSGFTGGMNVVIQAVKNLFSGLDLTTVDGLSAAIKTLGTAFFGLSSYVSGVIDSFKPLFDTLVAVGSGAKDADLSFLSIAGSLGGLVTQLNFALPLFDALIAILAAKAGLGLAKELAGLGAALPVVTSGLGAAGLAGAAGAAGIAVGTLLKDPIDRLVSSITGSETTLGGWIYDLMHAGDAAAEAGVKTAKAADGVKVLDGATKDAGQSLDKHNQTMLDNFAASEKAATATGKLADGQKEVSKYALQTVPIYDKLTGAITGYEQKLVKSATGTINLGKASGTAAGELSKIADSTEKAQEATRKWNEEVAKMAFQEKLKLIDSATKITTAQIEAMAKTTVASFDSISVSIKSTGDVLGSIFKDLDFSKIDWGSQRTIEKQIDLENKRRDEALVLQRQLTEAQIKQMNAQTDAMMRGDGMIKITGDGLEPHLEAFMWQILKNIQTRVNADGLKLLLGV